MHGGWAVTRGSNYVEGRMGKEGNYERWDPDQCQR